MMHHELATCFRINYGARIALISTFSLFFAATTFAQGRYQLPVPGTINWSLSPDGKYVTYTAQLPDRRGGPESGAVWIRPTDPVASPRMLPGTEGARLGVPFWSPDSRSVGYSAGQNLKKVGLTGEPPQTITAIGADSFRRGTWGTAGTIVFAMTNLFKVPALGGTMSEIVPAASSAPWFFPDGRHFLYKGGTDKPGGWAIYIATIDSPETKRLMDADSRAMPISGHILFTRGRTLFAQPFDDTRFEFTGNPVQIADDLFYDQAGGGLTGFDASENGILMYRAGSRENMPPTLTVITNWLALLKK
jgi:eukaryotic-like serine/threonine-protein kinase